MEIKKIVLSSLIASLLTTVGVLGIENQGQAAEMIGVGNPIIK